MQLCKYEHYKPKLIMIETLQSFILLTMSKLEFHIYEIKRKMKKITI